MFLHVSALIYLDEYRLSLTFNNHEVKVVDLQNELNGEVFEPLADVHYFRQVYLNDETGTIEWPNGADFAPEFLFDIGEDVVQKNGQHEIKTLVAA